MIRNSTVEVMPSDGLGRLGKSELHLRFTLPTGEVWLYYFDTYLDDAHFHRLIKCPHLVFPACYLCTVKDETGFWSAWTTRTQRSAAQEKIAGWLDEHLDPLSALLAAEELVSFAMNVRQAYREWTRTFPLPPETDIVALDRLVREALARV